MKKLILAIFISAFCLNSTFAGEWLSTFTSDPDSVVMMKWHHMDPVSDKIPGISTEKAYQEILKNKKSRTVIVAVMDSGVDVDHEDLKDNVWINTDEIPGNGIDDDNNGYVDDIHGWNFLGNAEGENIAHETLELTRLYKKYSAQFEGKTANNIPSDQKDEFEQYQKIKKEYASRYNQVKQEYQQMHVFVQMFRTADELLQETTGKARYSMEDLKSIQSESPEVMQSKAFIMELNQNGFKKDELLEYYNYISDQYNYHLNADFTPRKKIGDDPEVLDGVAYGNNDVKGAEYEHGTHVSGIIAAVRNNNLGMNGVTENVKIMAIRAVPNGDERDKDIANGIRYAVDNGAQIINMSFGKGYSPQKELIDDAVKYAESKGVLIIHGAGNDAKDLNKNVNYPTKTYLDKGSASNWITVGATSYSSDLELVAPFSNYGSKTVDIFAPGVDIYSLYPDDEYKPESGTSMAAPVTTGVAALLMSYYPELSAEQVKEIILESAVQYKKLKVLVPSEDGSFKKKKFKKLSVTGGVVNAYEAVIMAEEISAQASR